MPPSPLPQDYRRFPALLVLGCCKPAPLLLHGLPDSCRSRMAPHTYDLPAPSDRLNTLFNGECVRVDGVLMRS